MGASRTICTAIIRWGLSVQATGFAGSSLLELHERDRNIRAAPILSLEQQDETAWALKVFISTSLFPISERRRKQRLELRVWEPAWQHRESLRNPVMPWPSNNIKTLQRLSLGALLLVCLATLGDALEDVLAVLVKLELGDLNFAGGDADGDALAVGLLAGDALDVNHVLEAVAGGDLALTALVAAALDDNLVVLAEGDRADLVGLC